jgi:hypothetical protein
MGEWLYRSTFSWSVNSWRWVVSLTPRPLYPWEKSPRYPLDRMVGGPQSRSTRRRTEHFCPYRESNSEPSVGQPVASRYIDYQKLVIRCLLKYYMHCVKLFSGLYGDGEVWFSYFDASARSLRRASCCSLGECTPMDVGGWGRWCREQWRDGRTCTVLGGSL